MMKILQATVGHARLRPKKNSFSYKVFYMAVEVTERMSGSIPRLFSYNRWNLLSMRTEDHGARRKGVSWHTWFLEKAREANLVVHPNDRIVLIAHPRMLGYVFNPISYWVLYEKNTPAVKAVLCDVHNTFGDDHSYMVLPPEGAYISSDMVFSAKKHLYVSPFTLVNSGSYEFSFTVDDTNFASTINYYEDRIFTLNTHVGGYFSKAGSLEICKVFFMHPFMVFFVIMRIHWQAIRLFFKGVSPTLKTRRKDYTSGDMTIATLVVK